MKKQFLLTAIFTCLCFIAFNSADAQTSFDYYSKETLDAVGAAPEQQQKLKALKLDYDKKIRAARKDANLSDEEKKEKVKTYYKDRSTEYFEILTAEQGEYIKRLRKEFQEKKQD